MNPLPSMLPFAFFHFFLILLPPYVVPFDPRYLNCSANRCGELEITYPFRRIGVEADYCGHPYYGVECEEGGNLSMMIGDQKYEVLDIIKEKQSLTIVRKDVLKSICDPQQISPFITLGHLFSFTDDDLNVTLLSYCPMLEPSSELHEFNCSHDQGGHHFLNLTQPQPDFLPPSCHKKQVIPMLKSAAQDLTNNKNTVEAAAEALEKGFEVKWTLNTTECLACLNSKGECGYNTTLGKFSCFCEDGAHQSTCSGPRQMEASSRGLTWQLKLVIAAGTAIFMSAVFFLITRIRKLILWNRQSKGHQDIEDFIKNYGSLVPKRFRYSEVKRMTNSFKEKLGQGGFGAVYKGNLPNGTQVAVKLLHELKGDGEDFINEVASISRTSHVNIVTLLGFCFKGHRRALVYEFMPNQSLDKFICNEIPGGTRLGLERLHQIAVGTARGLEYLHRGCNTRILHFDIKPQNILLDDDFCPKISDFGLSKLCLKKESILSTLTTRGTIGYIAPEVFSKNFGGVSHKSDVYSYGMMLIDMVGGRKKLNEGEERSSQMYFPDRVYRLLEQHNVLGVLHDQIIPEENEIARKMIAVGLWCIQTVPSERPSMTRVIELLEGSIEAMQMPPKPYLFSVPRSSPLQSTSESL